MRRTYRSKKETAGALDPKDAIQAMDEKSSAFDAFYIQNIKQTKRELSCVGSSSHYGTAANKVRKRKYVKRIVKDTESSFGNSESHSVFLTPDKSIRVNKAQDLFDQLLISSPPQLDSPKNSWNSIRRVPNRQEAKTYTKRKLAKINCSSSDSTESDKENSNENCDTQNVTDLRTYELLVEKESKPSPKYLDESINRIVNNISLLNNINCHRNTPIGSAKKLFNNAKHRLTTNFQSPSNSPSCSTPFKEKYRSQSIYKFSPIAFGVNNASPDCTTIAEENANDSVVFVDNTAGSLKKSCCEENPPSPIIHLSTIRNRNSRKKTSSTNPELQFMPAHNSRTEEKEKESSKNKSNSNDVEISSIEISDLQTTESEPFLGFTNEPFKFEVVDCIENENGIGETDSMENKSDDEIFEDSNSIIENLSGNEDRVMKDATLSEIEEVENESSYDTCNSEQESQLDDIEASKVPILVIERLNDSVLQKYLHKTLDSDTDRELSNELDSGDYASFEGTDATRNNTANSSSLDSKENIPINHKSLVNTSDTDNSILTDSEFSNCNNEEDSVLQKYLHKTLDSDTDHELSNELDSDDYASFEGTDATRNNTANFSSLDRKENILINHKSLVNTSDTDNSILTDSEFSNCNNEEERCVSFVTTRRRNEITNDSLMYSLNNSCERYSCTDCEKTVLSNNAKVSLSPNIGVKNDADNVNSNDENVLTVTVKGIEEDCLEINNSVTEIENNRTSTMRSNSTRIHTANDLDVTNMSRRSIIDEGKPGIVLQPGKKWERSLSIYRRFTMMSDSCDKSMLDDEDVTSKGRKYRQSVINTIELQDKGSLHNESIISRRSTFVSKPCRSTIRIIKEPNTSRLSLGTTAVSEDLRGFLNEDCDDTIIELSKLSIADSEHEVTVIENFHDTSNRVSTARDYVLRRCSQSDAILFDECYPEAVLKNCRKIGEGVYGEVFLWRAGDGRARVMKIVPIAGTTKVNGERQKDFQEIISEIVIAMELSALRAPIDEIQREFDEGKSADSLDLHSVENATDIFNEVLAVRCVYGAYPSRLLDLWELYDECNGSENDNPAILPVDQQYIVLELANAGRDLESYEFNSAEQAHALFLQVAFGLAVGEEAYQFEHRDLHWGNVLIAPTDQKFATFVVRGRSHRVARCGVAATIIDYSLSRLSLPLAAGAGDAAALYNDLAADDGLFDAVGDYQFQVYRLMRDKLGNDWKNFEPYTNILWLHYTVDKMITALRYKRTNTKIHKHYIAKLKGIKNRLLEYGSAAQFVLTDNEF